MVVAPADLSPTPPADDSGGKAAGRGPRRRRGFWGHFLSNPLARIGLALIALLALAAIFAPSIALLCHSNPDRPLPNGLSALGQPHAPGGGFLLGADPLGRDVWTRTLFGARVSLLVALCAMLTAVLIGTTVGLIGGFYGGWVDVLLTRLTETVLSLPTILLAIALAAVLPGDGYTARLLKLLAAIALVTWTNIARAVRGQILSLKQREFVEAARAVGCHNRRIIWVHLLPNVMPTVIVLATLATAGNILLEAGLSYLGLGPDPSVPSWGKMISDGQSFFTTAPWIVLVPGTAIVLAVAGFNLLGQALQDVLESGR